MCRRNWGKLMKKILKNLTKSSFVKNVAIMASGTAGAQIISVALSPIITRLYGPEAFGIMGTFTALTRVIIPVAALTYPVAIVLPKDDKNAKGVIKLSLYITFIIASITALFILFFQNSIVDVFQLKEIAPYLFLIPLVILFSGVMQVIEQWFIRTNQFSINAKAHFMQSLVTNGGKVGIGFMYPAAIVLVVLQVFGNGFKAVLMVLFSRKSKYKNRSETWEKKLTIKEIAKKHRDFPLYRAPERLFNSFTQNLPILLLTSLFSPTAAGFYSIGRTVLGLPSRLIGKAIGDVFYPRINAAAHNGESVSRLIYKATLALGFIGLIPFGTVIFFGPCLFEFVFGTEWLAAGEYARWISLVSFSAFINKPSVKAMPVLSAQGFHLSFTIIKFILRSLALILGFLAFNSDIIAIALFGITSAMLNVILILITISISNKKY